MSVQLITDENGWLLCPTCKQTNTHINRLEARTPTSSLSVTASGEDGDAKLGISDDGRASGVSDYGNFRRHAFILIGYCEHCPADFAVGFTQHKGSTIVTLETKDWRSVE